MRAISFVSLLYLCLLVYRGQAQNVDSLPPGLKPRVGVTVLADGQPTNQLTGIKADAKVISFRALLDTKSDQFFNDFQAEVLIKQVEVILARNGRKIAQVEVKNGRLVMDFIQNPQPADHILFNFTLVAQREKGGLVAIPENLVYNFPIRE